MKWMGLMMMFHTKRDRGRSVGNLGLTQCTQSNIDLEAENCKPRAYTGPIVAQDDGNGDQSTDTEDAQHFFPDHDGLFRTITTTSDTSLELGNSEKNEPVDWGLCGNEDTMFKYDGVEEAIKPVLLDTELLDSRKETKTLASDQFLFDEAGASRFGAVVVKNAGKDEEEDDEVEFVDEDFAAREAHKEKEKNMKRRAQKLESNKDLYAEMAAARLADMRKDARYRKKRHSHNHTRSFAGSDESDIEIYDEDESEVVGEEVEGELEDTHQRRSSLRSRRSSRSHKKSFLSNSDKAGSVQNGYASEDEEEVEEEEDEEAVPSAADIPIQMDEVGSTQTERTDASTAEAKELRQLKKKYRAERRAKKRLMREKEEEERTALEAAELARAHRDKQRAREETKAREEQEKRDKKQRREMKEKLKREKAKQRQAKAEFRKLLELKQAEEERREREWMEKKEKKEKKKSKKKEKYTLPAERIHRKEEREAEHAVVANEAEAEISNALVIVEKPADTKTVQQPAVLRPTPASAVVSPSTIITGAAPTQQVTFASAPCAVLTPSPEPDTAVASVSATGRVEGAAASAQAMPVPMYHMSPPPSVPSYSTGPHNMPAYGLAATFGAYPPFYLAPYSYGGPTGLQPTFMRPNMGFVAGLSAMNSFGTIAGPAPAPFIQNPAEPMIGPQLPDLKENAQASLSGARPPSFPSFTSSPDKSTGPKLANLPELPDVIEF
ncbi:unnamed protein product [Peronospora belbahrii]|uniref:Stress response protein NST1 n=1 Tax=Peronospora belbahrii TaxID=622444 RepID=A0AAU9KSF2_9STRA|nr:unnamed protein product [Peronospora belbahrii]CAH0515290.1 unnamed protein product [Peronospora belbahrii]